MPTPPWKVTGGLDATLARWISSGYVRPCFAADRAFPASPEQFAPYPESLSEGLRRALASRGVRELYAHQAEAFALAMSGRDFVVATPTASGKSLCFHLPVLETFSRDPGARALYLYPTKALSRDQEASFGELVEGAGIAASRIVYDGDTPGDARRAARSHGRVVMTNPDMLSAGILPHHARWAHFFQGLKFVVLDELHVYRGVFGSHMAHVLARLKRVARFHGSNPTFLAATATIGNARDHAARLFGTSREEVAIIDRSGAPRAERRVFVFNPPVVNAELGIRASYLKSAVMLASDLIANRVPTIVFGPSRNSVEIMLKYLREALRDAVPEGSILAYRGGYLPETRRQIERDLREGKVLGVVATSALELGIDIGSLDAVVCAGYPGSIAALWQRFGRAGRRRGGTVALLVTSSAPVDQYFAREPEILLGAPAEEARIDAGNVEIALQHLKCAAFELPFVGEPRDAERYGCLDEANTREALQFLARHGVVHEANGRFHWTADAYPASHVSLRNIGWDNFVIIDREVGRVIAELDWRGAHTMLHEQAIYQHEAEQYQVEKLDFENHKAYVAKVVPDYFTQAMVTRKVSVIDQTASRPYGASTLAWGEISVIEKVTGYKKIKFYTHENAGYGEVRLPDIQMHTTSFWLTVAPSLSAIFGKAAAMDGLAGIGQALETTSTIALMCEPRDVGRAMGDERQEPAGSCFEPTLFLYDHVPGGVGLAERIFEMAADLLARARIMIAGCPCASGCPACVGPPITDAPAPAAVTRKAAALRMLAHMADG